MTDVEQGSGVQVVTMEDNHTYQLNETELKKIMLSKEIMNLPVVVVSVAGAFRGGKSFLLNYFLRYLSSSPVARADGSWLGEDSEPLTGFSWRGGHERNTTGILLWSKPFIRELPTGEKVAVLLMDTQGTFDNTSTVRDCSTIFALSTLLSSTQIYNLTSSIKEDDLQNLQLFTDYGKLMRDKTGEAFQVLEFLVRDWMNVHEFKYGQVGGESYLEKTLDITRNQPRELKELRQHILASFDKVTCFLMPHPGLDVWDPKFNGSTSEIQPQFKETLKELASLLFSSEKLTLKVMGGQPVKSRELFNYFKTYISIFNSDTVPTPKTILQATAEAGLMMAYNDAREQFENNMKQACGTEAPSMPAQDVIALHTQELANARDAFNARKLFGDRKSIKNKLETLTEELKNRLKEYIEINASKTMRAKLKAFAAYDKAVEKVCVHPNDLTKVHEEAIEVAKKVFDEDRKMISSAVDTDKEQLVDELASKYSILQIANTHNNNTIIDELRDEYFRFMMELCNKNLKPDDNTLKTEHEKALARAITEFESRRNFPNNYTEDTFKHNLEQTILSQYKFMKPINASKNKKLFQKGLLVYKNNFISLSELRRRCLHPDDLEKQHEDAMEKAFQAFRNDNEQNVDDDDDVDELLLDSILRDRYDTMVDANILANNNAVEMGVFQFKKEFDKLTVTWYTGLFGMTQGRRQHWLDKAMPVGVDAFYERRLNRNHHNIDIYLARLKSECKDYAQVVS